MGYYTDFELIWTGDEEEELSSEVIKSLEEISGYSFSSACNVAWLIAKWYSWEENLTRLSKKFPNLTFELKGEGEEGEDIWKAKVKNGNLKVVRASIQYPEDW